MSTLSKSFSNLSSSNPGQQLRDLIDALEERYSLLQTPNEGVHATLGSTIAQDALVAAAANRLYALSAALSSQAEVVRSEAKNVGFRERRLHNARQPALHPPPELLSYIFELALFSQQEQPLQQKFGFPSSAAFSHVRQSIIATCSHWRNVALNTTSLWSRVVMNNRAVSDKSILRYLDRAGSRPLDLFLEVPFTTTTHEGPAAQDHHAMIHSSFRRCRVLNADVSCVRSDLLSSILESPYLRTAILTRRIYTEDRQQAEFDLTQAKSLQYLWINLDHKFTHTVTVAPESSITHLHLENERSMTVSHVTDILNSCPSLEVLELQTELKDTTSQSSSSSQPLQPLLNLRHFACDAWSLAQLANSGPFVAPNITTLKLSAPTSPHLVPNTSYLRRLRFPSLQSLEIIDPDDVLTRAAMPDIIAFIQGNSEIKEVVLDVMSSDRLMNYLVDHPRFCLPPQLMHLWTFSGSGDIGLPELPVFWQSRWQPSDKGGDESNGNGGAGKRLTVHVRDMWLRAHGNGARQFERTFRTNAASGGSIDWKAEDYENVWDWRGDVCGLL